MLAIINAMVFSLLGVGLFLYLNLPLPWLLGAIFPLLFLSRLKKLSLQAPKPLIHPARALLGVAIGSSFTPHILSSFDIYMVSLAFMLPFLVCLIGIGYFYYFKVIGYDKKTSMFCALPGGLLEMTIMCESQGAHLKKVMTTQATRLLLIVYVIPFILQFIIDIDLSGNLIQQNAAGVVLTSEVIILIMTALLGWWLAEKIGLSGASIVGPMTAVAILYLSGIISYKLHGEMINLAQLILGVRLGLSFSDIRLNVIIKNALYASGLFLISLVLVSIFAYVIHFTTDIPLIATFLAYVPGGQAEMNVIAIVIGIHVPYIALHHVARMFLVIAFAPKIAKLAR